MKLNHTDILSVGKRQKTEIKDNAWIIVMRNHCINTVIKVEDDVFRIVRNDLDHIIANVNDNFSI